MIVKARLKPGVTLSQAETGTVAVGTSLSDTRPEGWDPAGTFTLEPTTNVLLLPQLDGVIRGLGALLMVVVGLVLLLACTNLAGFLLAHGLDRRRDVAVRLAVGAPRGALIGQLLTETLLLGLLGGMAGFGLAMALMHVVPSVDLGTPMVGIDFTPDATVLGFTLGVSLLAGILVGLIPALQSTRVDLVAALTSEAAGGEPAAGQRWRRILVIVQLAVSMVLLVAAGLVVRSLQYQHAVDLGFGHTPTATMSVAVSSSRFGTALEGRRYLRRLLDRFRLLPGIEAVGLINVLPLSGGNQWINFVVDGHTPPQGQEAFRASRAIVDPGFFDAAGVPVLQGRAFTDADRPEGTAVAIVSATLARTYWPEASATGQLLRVTGGSPALPGGFADLRVVGVARDIRWGAIGEEPRPLIYLPHAQHPASTGPGPRSHRRGCRSDRDGSARGRH